MSHQLVLKQVLCTALYSFDDYYSSFNSGMTCVRVLFELKSSVEPKCCLFLDVLTSSLEVDLRVPGNRDKFPFL